MAVNAVAVDIEPPGVIRLLAHPVRWRLLRELASSDRTVRELTELVDEPQNLVSYHLRQLRDGGLVSARRSSADGRDSYYAVDSPVPRTRCRRRRRAAPGLVARPGTPLPTGRTRAADRGSCSCAPGTAPDPRSPRRCSAPHVAGTIDAASAGSHPKPLHPNAVRVLRERGIDISANRTKHLDEFARERFDAVITLCDRVREVCPEFPVQPERVHWSMADPAAAGDTTDERRTRRSNAPPPSSRRAHRLPRCTHSVLGTTKRSRHHARR